MLRYHKIINSKELLETRLLELTKYFISSGYPKTILKKVRDDVLQRKRVLKHHKKDEKPPFNISWVATSSPATPQIKKVVINANKVLQKSESWKDEQSPIGVVHKRSLNLGNRLFKRKRFALTDHNDARNSNGTQQCTQGNSRKRGRPCKGCKLMSGRSSITSHSNGKIFHTPPATCKTKMVIYAAECKLCSKQYTGRTIQEIRKRINGHRGWMTKIRIIDGESKNDDEDEASLADHLKLEHGMESPNHFDEMFQFTVLQIGEPKTLVDMEYKWINALKTLTPFGLNISKPYGITEKFI